MARAWRLRSLSSHAFLPLSTVGYCGLDNCSVTRHAFRTSQISIQFHFNMHAFQRGKISLDLKVPAKKKLQPRHRRPVRSPATHRNTVQTKAVRGNSTPPKKIQSGVVTKYQTYPDQEKEKRTPRPHLDSTLCTIPKVLVLVLPVYTVPNVPYR